MFWARVSFENVFPVFITSSTLLLIHCSLRLLYQLTSWYANETQTQMQSGGTNEEIDVDLRLSVIKPLHATWLWVFFENVFPVFITSSTLLLIHCSLLLVIQSVYQLVCQQNSNSNAVGSYQWGNWSWSETSRLPYLAFPPPAFFSFLASFLYSTWFTCQRKRHMV